MLFNLYFVNNTILSCFFLFFFIIDLHFLIHAIITKNFYPIVEFAITRGITSKEANVEMETDTVIIKIARSKCSV